MCVMFVLYFNRNSISHQCQLAIAQADSESLARSIAEETISDLEKERTIKELELKDLMSRHRAELSNKDTIIANVRTYVYYSLPVKY